MVDGMADAAAAADIAGGSLAVAGVAGLEAEIAAAAEQIAEVVAALPSDDRATVLAVALERGAEAVARPRPADTLLRAALAHRVAVALARREDPIGRIVVRPMAAAGEDDAQAELARRHRGRFERAIRLGLARSGAFVAFDWQDTGDDPDRAVTVTTTTGVELPPGDDRLYEVRMAVRDAMERETDWFNACEGV